MKVQIKSSILIITLLVGIILSQGTATVPTGAQPTAAQPSVVSPSVPMPTGVQPSGAQPTNTKPSGVSPSVPKPSGGLRGESGKKPEGPSNIPPKEGGYSDKLAAISDEKVLRLKNLLKFLPRTEQDLLAGNLNL